MFVDNTANIEGNEVGAPGAVGASKKSLIGPNQGWEGWVMRQFTLQPGGCTPRHSHPWPHINYITAGEGTLYLDGTEHPVQAGSIAYVPSNKEHQYLNAGNAEFAFLCIVPEEGDA